MTVLSKRKNCRGVHQKVLDTLPKHVATETLTKTKEALYKHTAKGMVRSHKA